MVNPDIMSGLGQLSYSEIPLGGAELLGINFKRFK